MEHSKRGSIQLLETLLGQCILRSTIPFNQGTKARSRSLCCNRLFPVPHMHFLNLLLHKDGCWRSEYQWLNVLQLVLRTDGYRLILADYCHDSRPISLQE